MTFRIHELRRAQADIRSIFQWLRQRSPMGAIAWLDAYDRMVERLKQDAETFADAHENADMEFHVRQAALQDTSRPRLSSPVFR